MWIKFLSQTSLIILAAGRSSRAGSLGVHKGLRPWPDEQGLPLFRVHLRSFFEAGGSRAVLVLGHLREEFTEALAAFRSNRIGTALGDAAQRLVVAVNKDPDRGPFSSIQCGLTEALCDDVSWFWILPVDSVPSSVFEALSEAASREPHFDIYVPEFEGRGGHPILISRVFAEYLVRCDHGSRLDHEIKKSPNVRRVLLTDARILANLND
jgi:CTP:molybdopterin cytidylyltransferase MocA